MPEITNYMFSSGDWRTNELTEALPQELRDKNVSMSHLDYSSEMYPLALEKAFSFMSSSANGRYSDRTMMTLKRVSDRWRNTTPQQRYTFINDELGANPYMPYVFIVESPYSWDDETEIKRGGILGALVCLPNDEGEYRGILAVAENARKQGIGKCLLERQQAWTGVINMYAHQSNAIAMRLAASVGMGPIQVNSSTGAVQYGRTEVLSNRRRNP
jgi:hypothetical protein